MTFLESEIKNIKNIDNEKDYTLLASYHKVVLNCCKEIVNRFPDTITTLLEALMSNFMNFESNQLIPTSASTGMFLREIIEKKGDHRASLFKRLNQIFDEIRGPPVIRMSVWMLGEFAESKEEVEMAFNTIRNSFGSTPLTYIQNKTEEESKETPKEGDSTPQMKTETVILPDGSYSTRTVYV